MVDMTPEQFMAMKRGDRADVLSKIDRDIVGANAAQLLLALDHPISMAERADMLVGLGARLKSICARTDWPMRTLMLEYRTEVRGAQRMLDELGKGVSRTPLRSVEGGRDI